MRRVENNLRKHVLVKRAQNAHNEACEKEQNRLNEARRHLFFQMQKDIINLQESQVKNEIPKIKSIQAEL